MKIAPGWVVLPSLPTCRANPITFTVHQWSHIRPHLRWTVRGAARSSHRPQRQDAQTATFQNVRHGRLTNAHRRQLAKCCLRMPKCDQRYGDTEPSRWGTTTSSQTPALLLLLLLLLLSGRGCAAGSGWARWRQPFVITFNTCLCRWKHFPLSSDRALLFAAVPSSRQRRAQHLHNTWKRLTLNLDTDELVLATTVTSVRKTDWQIKGTFKKRNKWEKAWGGLASNSQRSQLDPSRIGTCHFS